MAPFNTPSIDRLFEAIRHLESRGVIMQRAEDELGMHGAQGDELAFWPGEGT